MVKRRRSLALLASAIALLAVGSWLARDGLSQLSAGRYATAALEAKKSALDKLLPEAVRREQFAALSLQVEAEVVRLGFQREQWAERRIQRQAGVLPRRDADALLRDLAGGNGRLFAADTFELSVLSPDAGLFTTPVEGEKGLSLAASGSLYFRIAK